MRHATPTLRSSWRRARRCDAMGRCARVESSGCGVLHHPSGPESLCAGDGQASRRRKPRLPPTGRRMAKQRLESDQGGEARRRLSLQPQELQGRLARAAIEGRCHPEKLGLRVHRDFASQAVRLCKPGPDRPTVVFSPHRQERRLGHPLELFSRARSSSTSRVRI